MDSNHQRNVCVETEQSHIQLNSTNFLITKTHADSKLKRDMDAVLEKYLENMRQNDYCTKQQLSIL